LASSAFAASAARHASYFFAAPLPKDSPLRFSIHRRLRDLGRASAAACLAWLLSGCPLSDAYFVDTDPAMKPKPAPKMDGGGMMMMGMDGGMMMPGPMDKMDGGMMMPATMGATDAMAPRMMPDMASGTTTELARGKTVVASSEQTSKGNVASLANDGDSTTRWSASAATVPSWWRVDLGAVHTISRVEIDWEFPRAYGYRVEGSNDDSTYATLMDRSGSTDMTQNQFCDFNTSARYVRITVTAVTTNPISWPSMWEVRVYGQ
jgi:hypothetical protein